MRKTLSCVRRAADDYKMIDDGDVIGVGISGGKDSVLLFNALLELRRFYPKKFEVVGLTIDLGFDTPLKLDGIIETAEKYGARYEVAKTGIKEVVFDTRKEPNPCSLCAKMRKGALVDLAKANGCNKMALGHNFDDIVETFFLKLLYEGSIGCFSPVSYLDRNDIYQIRPLMYMPEDEIKPTVERLELPIFKNPCPAAGATKRQEIKELIANLRKTYPDIKEKVFGGLQRGNIDGYKSR